MAARVITFGAQKGGVGKSTNIIQSCLLARLNQKAKVLLVDVDPQCNSSGVLMSYDDLIDPKMTKASELYGNLDEFKISEGKYGIDIIPGDDGIHAFPTDLSNAAVSEIIRRVQSTDEISTNDIIQDVADEQLISFAQNINRLKEMYDYIFIDVPPSFLGLPLVSALCVCTDVIGILEPTKFSSYVVDGFIEKVQSIKDTFNEKMTFHGFIVNKYRANSKRHVDRVKGWKETFGDFLIGNPIKVAAWIENRTEDGEPVFMGSRNSHDRAGSDSLTSTIFTVFPEWSEK